MNFYLIRKSIFQLPGFFFYDEWTFYNLLSWATTIFLYFYNCVMIEIRKIIIVIETFQRLNVAQEHAELQWIISFY